MKLKEAYVGDEGGYLYIGFIEETKEGQNELLSLFRRNYIKNEERSLKASDLVSGYTLHVSEMEAYSVNQTINKREFEDAIRIWAKELPDWALQTYSQADYISHIAFRDKLHEGIFESLTLFNTGCLYWYHG